MDIETLHYQEIKLTEIDLSILGSYAMLAESIAALIGPHCEIVVHSFENFEKSVIAIVNGHHTDRKVGSPMTDLGLSVYSQFKNNNELTPKAYFAKTKDGKLLKSSTCIILGHKKEPIGMFCININLSAPFTEIIETLMPTSFDIAKIVSEENFYNNPDDVINQAISNAITSVNEDATIHAKFKNKMTTKILFENGIFKFKGATNIVASRLEITTHAVYKLIRSFKTS